MTEENQFDGIFMNVIQHQKGIEGFFETIFSFLRRNTDFYTNEQHAQKVIIEECQKQFDVFTAEKQKKQAEEAEQQKQEEARRLQQEAKKLAQNPPATTTTTVPEVEQKQPVVVEAPQTEPVVKTQETAVQIPDGQTEQQKQEDKDKDEKAPLGNGGRTEKYIWTQTLQELNMYIFVPQEVKGKDLVVKFDNLKCYVGLKGQPPIIDGEWPEKVHRDESDWTLEDTFIQDYNGKHVHLTIAKWKNQWHWWDSAIKGDAQINTQKIQPESSRLDELDGETRGTVEQMMFDMRQKQMGLPTSDELKKKDMMDGFMQSHPEMDFSKCKFS